MISVSVTEAARHLVELIQRVRHRREPALLTEGGNAVVRLTPVGSMATGADLARTWRGAAHLDGAEAERFEADLARARGALPNSEAKWD